MGRGAAGRGGALSSRGDGPSAASAGGVGAKLPNHATWIWAANASDVGRMISGVATRSGASTTEQWPGCERGPTGKQQPTDQASGAWKGWAISISTALSSASNPPLPGVVVTASQSQLVTVVQGMRVFAGPMAEQ